MRKRLRALIGTAFACGLIVSIAPNAAAFRQPTEQGQQGSQLQSMTAPGGLTISAQITGGRGVTNVLRNQLTFDNDSYGYNPQDHQPRPGTARAFLPGLPAARDCPSIGVCPDRGTLSFEFSHPVQDVRMHITELGGGIGSTTWYKSTSARLTTTTPDVSPAVVSGRNLHVTADGTIEPINKATRTNCNSNENNRTCGTIEFSGLTDSLDFDLSSWNYPTLGNPPPNSRGADEFPVTFTFGEDFGDAPASYEEGNAASAIVSDLRIGDTVTADNESVPNSTVSQNASEDADGDSDDGIPGGPDSVERGEPYRQTIPLNGLSAPATICSWIDFNISGTFGEDERTCTDVDAGANSATLEWPATQTDPADFAEGSSFMRIRLGYDEAATSSPTGRSDSGEIEDYPITLQEPPTTEPPTSPPPTDTPEPPAPQPPDSDPERPNSPPDSGTPADPDADSNADDAGPGPAVNHSGSAGDSAADNPALNQSAGDTDEPGPPERTDETAGTTQAESASEPELTEELQTARPTPGPDDPRAPGRPNASGRPQLPGIAPLRMDLRLDPAKLAPGTAGTIRGTLGPNLAPAAARIDISGQMTQGVRYTAVSLSPDGEPCTVYQQTFTCAVTLNPKESIDINIQVMADGLTAPPRATQHISIDSSLPGQNNVSTMMIPTTGGDPSDTETLADQITKFPGALIPIFALFMFALAAMVAERKRRSQRDDTTS